MDGNEQSARIEASGAVPRAKPSDASRWIAAVGYLSVLCFFALWHARRDEFIRAHSSQAVLLFIAECFAVAAAVILGSTVGRMRIIGPVIVALFGLVAALAALMLSMVGFVKALFGRDWLMPFLGEHREKVPGLHWQEG